MGVSQAWLKGLLLASAVGMAAACSPAAAPGGGAQSGSGAAPAAGGNVPQPSQPIAQAGKPKYGGTIILGQRDTPRNLNYYEGVFASQVVFHHYYEPLIHFDQTDDFRVDFPVKPWLAEKWEQPDDKTWVFTLRDGVKFHDGTPLTAEGVVWSLEYLRDTNNKFPARSNLAAVDTIKAEGNKVILGLKAPTPNFLNNLNETYILPKHIFDQGGAEALSSKGVGTGPFSLVSTEPTSKTNFKKFNDYWGKDADGNKLPYLDGIQHIHNMDGSTQQAAFAAQQLDIIPFSDKAQLDAFQRRVKDVKIAKFIYSSDPGLAINFDKPNLAKLEVRKALHLILNRQEINENFAGGEALLSVSGISAIKTGWVPTQEELAKMPGYRANKEEDLAEAKKLLQQAGVPLDMPLVLITPATFGNAPQGEQAVNQLQRFGFKAQYRALDDATFNKEERDGNWDLALKLHANAEPVRARNWFHSKGGTNFGKLADPEVDALIEKLETTMDINQQKVVGRQIVDALMAKQYSIPLVTPAIYDVTQPWVNGWHINGAIQLYLNPENAVSLWVDTDKLPAARK